MRESESFPLGLTVSVVEDDQGQTKGQLCGPATCGNAASTDGLVSMPPHVVGGGTVLHCTVL